MSQDNAESSELAKLNEKFKNPEKEDRVTEIEVTDMSKVTTSSDSKENSSEVDNNDAVEEDDEVEGPESNVFRNPVLLKLISENADFSTLKSLRSLNKLCKEVVTGQLTNKSRIVLDERTKSQEELEAIKNLKGITDLKISVKLFNKTEFGFEKEGEMLIDILEHFSQNLKVLELEIWENDGIPLPSPSIQFPALSTLKYRGMDMGEEKERRFIQFVYASAPNLTELVLKCLFPQDLSLLLADDESRNWALAPKLKSLIVTNLLSPKGLLHLINFPQTWESLDIKISCLDDDADVYENIGWLLDKNKDTLIRLSLQQHFGWFSEDRQTLRFPKTFPKLQKLKLAFDDPDCQVNSGGSAINYSKTFPALISLSIELGYGEFDLEVVTPPRPSRLWGSLFSPQVFNGLKHLKLTYDGLRHEEGIAEDWAQKMFPNARLEINNWM